jgi:hypothetical protein
VPGSFADGPDGPLDHGLIVKNRATQTRLCCDAKAVDLAEYFKLLQAVHKPRKRVSAAALDKAAAFLDPMSD